VKIGRRGLVIGGAAVGAALALILTLNVEPYCIGGGDVFSCPYKAFLWWDTAPILVDTLWTIGGALGGALVGAMLHRVSRHT
jgi:hypothetical protein